MKALAPLLLLVFACLVFSLDSLAVDSIAADSIAADTVAGDTLREGVKADTALALAGRNCVLALFTFQIPVARALEKLRSDAENKALDQGMDQDAEERFDGNDICFPVGLVYGRALSPWIQARAGLSFLSIKNSNAWTPRTGDTVHTGRHVNSYALKALSVSLEAQFNISRTLMTVDNFNRFYVALCADLCPWVSLKTERTEIGGRVDARGFGWGRGIFLGAERFLDERSTLSGELGYTLTTMEGFDDKGAIRDSDIYLNGGDAEFSVYLKSLKFRFYYGRWF
jgi:hypothetical protein